MVVFHLKDNFVTWRPCENLAGCPSTSPPPMLMLLKAFSALCPSPSLRSAYAASPSRPPVVRRSSGRSLSANQGAGIAGFRRLSAARATGSIRGGRTGSIADGVFTTERGVRGPANRWEHESRTCE